MKEPQPARMLQLSLANRWHRHSHKRYLCVVCSHFSTVHMPPTHAALDNYTESSLVQGKGCCSDIRKTPPDKHNHVRVFTDSIMARLQSLCLVTPTNQQGDTQVTCAPIHSESPAAWASSPEAGRLFMTSPILLLTTSKQACRHIQHGSASTAISLEETTAATHAAPSDEQHRQAPLPHSCNRQVLYLQQPQDTDASTSLRLPRYYLA